MNDFQKKLMSTLCCNWEVYQVIVFEWHDMAREGLCCLSSPNCAFHFKILGEKGNLFDYNDSLFFIEELSLSKFNEIAEILKILEEPVYPIWVPIWKFDSIEIREKVDEEIDKLFLDPKEKSLIIQTCGFEKIINCWLFSG